MNRPIATSLATVVLSALPLAEAMACAVCRPDADHPLAHAADMSVVFLGLLVMAILGMFCSFFGYLWYRNRNPLLDPGLLVAEGSQTVEGDAAFPPRESN